MRLRIEEAILATEPCSSGSQVISEDSDLYWPFKYPTGKKWLLLLEDGDDSRSSSSELL